MSDRLVIVDTGALVAYLDERDRHHAWAEAQFRVLPAPLLTCEPVLGEAFFLLSRLPRGGDRFLRFLETGSVAVSFQLMGELQSITSLVEKYADVPMSLADACLVRMVELNPGASVMTLDSDFRIYRQHGRRVVPVIMP